MWLPQGPVPLSAVFYELAEEFNIMKTERVYRWGKDTENYVQQMEEPRQGNSKRNIAGETSDVVSDEGEQYGGESYGHDTDVGNDITDALQKLEGREETAREDKERSNDQDCNDKGPGEKGGEISEQGSDQDQKAHDGYDVQGLIERLFMGVFPEGAQGTEKKPKEDVGRSDRNGKSEHGQDRRTSFDAEMADAENPLEKIAEELAVEEAKEKRVSG